MHISLKQMTNGLTPEHDFFFPEQPQNPEMRESTSMWIFEENGEFGFPRIGIEAEAHSWDNRLYHANFNLGDGRILIGGGRGAAPSPFDADGRPTILGAGPLSFHCIEPFRRWLLSYEGTAAEGTVAQQMEGPLSSDKQVPVKLELELTMETPAWVQDNSPERVAKMSEAERADAQSMGIGWRLEHLCRGKGILTVDGNTREFNAVGSRIKRQSIRPLNTFRGHCWQSALFPDGRAFGYIAYPPDQSGNIPYNEGYIFQGGIMYPARATRIPFLRQIIEEGDDVSLELESKLGVARIGGSTLLSTFRVNNPEMAALGAAGFSLQQSGARYTWDGMTSYGMIERSSTAEQMAG